ncbi:MAG: mechanosensitive ion channel family protein [Candidatus Thermoplasmatota archaeon]|nr:mechanosensitive ion channel family protein [Candidatus Thermoplasmatota archaeon]
MANGFWKETRRVIIVIVAAIVIVIAAGYAFDFIATYEPILVPYRKYILYAIVAIVIFGFAHIINRTIGIFIEKASSKPGKRNYRGLYTLFRAVIYGGAIAAFLAYIGISLTGALIGGTIGGLIISFALQNTVSSLLSGLLLSSSGVIKPKEPIFFFSWLFNNPVVGEVLDVSILTTKVRTTDGLVTDLPNTALLGQSQFTSLVSENRLSYNILIGFNPDVPIRQIINEATASIDKIKEKIGLLEYQSYFFTKTFNNNSVKVIFFFNDLEKFNQIVHEITAAYEEAYWKLKNKMTEDAKKPPGSVP